MSKYLITFYDKGNCDIVEYRVEAVGFRHAYNIAFDLFSDEFSGATFAELARVEVTIL